jgi:ribosome-associated protein
LSIAKKKASKKKTASKGKSRARVRPPIPAPERGKGHARAARPARVPSLPPPSPSDDARKVALFAAQAGLDKKAAGVEIIDVTGKVDYADYLVLMTGHSDRHVAAIAESVDAMLSQNGFRAISMEGMPAANWVLIDFVDVVVHVFEETARVLYDLDGLWMDARRVPVEDSEV